MIDKKDIKAIDAFPFKKRGRPSTGSALTAAQRMAKKREADKLVIVTARYQSDFAVLSTQGLLQAMQHAVTNKYKSDARKIAAELVKRASMD